MKNLAVAVAALLVLLTSSASFGMSQLKDFCEIARGAPISERCYGFVAAIVELSQDQHTMPNPGPGLGGVCIPYDLTTEQIIRKLRPWLRKRGDTCYGHCDATSYIEEALIATFACNGRH